MIKVHKEAGGKIDNGKAKYFKRNVKLKLPYDIEQVKQMFNNEDVYITPYTYFSDDINNSLLYAPFYLDLDLEVSKQDEYNQVRTDALMVLSILMNEFKIPLEYIKIYYSGNKGFHFIINPIVFGIRPSKTLNEDFKLVARRIKSYTFNKTIDTVIYDKRRLVRVPNTINSKSGLYKVRISKEILETYTYEQLREYAKEPKPDPNLNGCTTIKHAKDMFDEYRNKQYEEDTSKYKKATNNKKKKAINSNSDILPCVAYILENGAEIGARNNTMIALSSALFQSGGTLEEVTDIILEWNKTKNDNSKNPISDREVIVTVNSAYQRFQSGMIYGCSAFRELDYCLGNLCSLYNNRYKGR